MQDIQDSRGTQGASPTDRPTARLANEARQAELQAAINAAQAELCGLMAEHEREAWWADHTGILSETGYQSWRHGHTPHSARRLIEIGRALHELPKVRDAFGRGELSLDCARILTDICEPDTQDRLLDLARGLSGAQLSRFASHYRGALTIERDQAHNEHYLSSRHNHDGSWSISGRLPSEEGAIVDRAISKAMDLARAQGGGPDDQANDPFAAERADALVAMAESLLAHGLESRPGPERYQVVIDIDIDKLTTDSIAKIRGGGIVSARTAEMIACDSSIIEVISNNGDPLDVGRKHRFPTTPLRRALQARDRCCCYPGCHRTAGLDNHHDHQWHTGGKTKVKDMRRFCRGHHVRWHKGEFTVERTADEDIYRDANGNMITRQPLRATPGSLERVVRDGGVVIDEFTCLPEWMGERGNSRYIADTVLQNRALRKDTEDNEREGRGPPDDGFEP